MIEGKGDVMKTSFNWNENEPIIKTLYALIITFVLLFSQNVFADTAANTRITNSVEVTYSDAFGLNETTSAPVSVTVTVVLLPASPTLSIITSDIDPAHEDSDNTLTYSISWQCQWR
jgi:hypothetical protein